MLQWNKDMVVDRMASQKIIMYCEKKYELEELKNLIKEEIVKILSDIKFEKDAFHVLGEGKVLMMIFEKWYLRNSSYASLVILISEYSHVHCADIISTGGKENFFSLGAEGHFVNIGVEALQNLGFKVSTQKK